jgi:hypothetical protein
VELKQVPPKVGKVLLKVASHSSKIITSKLHKAVLHNNSNNRRINNSPQLSNHSNKQVVLTMGLMMIFLFNRSQIGFH